MGGPRAARTPPPNIPNPSAHKSCALRDSAARARGRRRTRTRTSSRSPARAALAPARAHLRLPLCVSSIRYVQNGPSAAAAAPGGRGRRRGGGGGAQVWRRGRGGPGGGKLGERGFRGAWVGATLPPFPSPLAVAPYFKAIPASPPFPARTSWNLADQGGFSSCCPLPKTQNPNPRKNHSCCPLSPLPVPITFPGFCMR